MRYSKLFSPTLRDTPADAEVVSHQLLLRAGFIRRVTSGVYDYLPLGLRVLRNIEKIVREEMNRAGAQELLMPMVQPSEFWQKSERWDKYGPELLRFKDRHGHESCLGPTHEEVICDLVSRELKSYKQLPMNLYQVQNKFRDEIRPRFGLMRGREFVMKDAYSFHASPECLAKEYQNMFDTYHRIFNRLGLKFRAVEADNGSIGGSASHEFHVLAESGEDLITHCSACDYAANVEKALSTPVEYLGEDSALIEVSTPNKSAVEDVATFLKVKPSSLLKTLVYVAIGGENDGQIIAACVRGNDNVQEIKLARTIGADEVTLASVEQLLAIGTVTGFAGPIQLNCPIYIDQSLQHAVGLVAGANKKDIHITGLNINRDIQGAIFADLRETQVGDTCGKCGKGHMEMSRGIEVGHIFELGTVYAKPMEVLFQNEQGKRDIATMGCYGIGVSRLMAAVVEQCNDDYGIMWPVNLAPFQISVITLGKSESAFTASEKIYTQLLDAGVDVIWDDRKESPGVKFKDAELTGIPLRIVVGDRGLDNNTLEIKTRWGGKEEATPDAASQKALDMLHHLQQETN
ncbi:proline--tRNA ligase [Ghiorsea bivora]|uniref:proline--tRNA ligase n=1 Tax=Ghiorsea bivora TaxID=1485545 RepID=UPI000571CC76|nr:proline--tRNA ligase [Ghiorsea bivora]